MRVTKPIDATVDEVESARQSVFALMKNDSQDTLDLFFTENLQEIETGIKKLNEFSTKSWLLSAILLYTLIYDKGLYQQSGLEWKDYAAQARERLGLDARDITEQLSAARFFIKHHVELERGGFSPAGSNRKLARAEMATDLCGDVHETIRHIIKDTWADYHDWYSSFKMKSKKNSSLEFRRNDIRIEKGKFFIGENEAVNISGSLKDDDKARLEKYITQIFEAMQKGYEPAIIETYNTKEAAVMVRLRDKYRQGK